MYPQTVSTPVFKRILRIPHHRMRLISINSGTLWHHYFEFCRKRTITTGGKSMSYVESNLIPGEQVLYKTGLHWIVLFWPSFVGAFFLLIGFPLFFMSFWETTAEGREMGVVGFGMLAFAALVAGLGYLVRKATEMAVTNKRIIIKTGLLSRRTFELLLTKVESIGVEEGILGRMLGYGSVIVRGTGGTPEPFKNVAHPLEFRRQVQQRVEDREQK